MSLTKQQNSKENNVSPKRRALIKGSATAVPMVLTLRSGAAFAAGSAGACVAKMQDNPPSPAPGVLVEAKDMASDNWYRYITTGRVLKLIEKDGKPASGNSFVAFRDPMFSEGDPSARYYRDTKNTQYKKYFTDMPDSGTPPTEMKNKKGNKIFSIESEANDCYVLCLVDREGNPLSPPTFGAAFDSGEFPFATSSCMTSIT